MNPPIVDVVYLNLGSATTRNAAFLEKYHACHFAPHWNLKRFHAIDAQHELVRNAPGRLAPGNKGCTFSSLECLRESFDNDHYLYILDDDIQFCALSQACVDDAIRAMPEDGWDILYTDTTIPNAMDMPRLLMMWHEFQQGGQMYALDLASVPFGFCAGTSLINPRAKRKIHDLMKTGVYDIPWDLTIREHIKAGRVRATLMFPFVTTVSALADDSQINVERHQHTERVLCNEFRRMMWLGYQQTPYYSEWARQHTRCELSDEVMRFNAIMTPLLSIQLAQRWFRPAGADVPAMAA